MALLSILLVDFNDSTVLAVYSDLYTLMCCFIVVV
jgi:hypothetical protein